MRPTSPASWRPNYLNDLDRFPLAEITSGKPDPSQVWPYPTNAVSFVVQLAGFLVAAPGPLILPAAAVASGVALGRGWRRMPRALRLVHVAGLVIALSTVAAILSPQGVTVLTRLLD